MTDLQAALGAQPAARGSRSSSRRRHELAARYDRLLADLPLTRPWPPDRRSAWHLYVVRLDSQAHRQARRQVFDALRAAGIGVNVHYIPVHPQPYYRALGFRPAIPGGRALLGRALTLPLYPAMTEADQDAVIASLKQSLS